jgi:hypothetical protein
VHTHFLQNTGTLTRASTEHSEEGERHKAGEGGAGGGAGRGEGGRLSGGGGGGGGGERKKVLVIGAGISGAKILKSTRYNYFLL